MFVRFLGKLGKHLVYVILVITCFLTSCSPKKPISFHKPTLRLNLYDDPLSWDPRCVRLLKDITLLSHLFEGITRHSKNDTIENGVAEKIILSEDKKTYLIYLKEAFWSNGDPVTAQDFKSSWVQILQPNFPAFYSHFLDVIKNGKEIKQQLLPEEEFGVKVLSDKVFSIELAKPYPYFTELLSLPIFFPVHESLRKSIDEQQIVFPLVSNGAFKLVHWQPKFNIKFEKNPYYWENSEINLQCIDMSVIADVSTEVLLFEKQHIDWLGQPWAPNILPEARDKLIAENKLSSYEVAGTCWLLINTESFPLNNVKLRQALSLALNKESIIKYILKGNQTSATSALPKSLSSLPKYLLDTQANISLAKKLFDEALLELNLTTDSFPQITLIYPSSNTRRATMVQEIQQQWKKHLNLSINLQGYEYRFFLEKRNQGTYQIATADWIADYADPLAFLQILANTSQQKYTLWTNPTFSQLIIEAKEEVDHEKRMQKMQTAEKILLNELPVLPLYHYSFDYALSKNIKDVVFYPSGVVNLNYVKIEK